MASSSAGQPPTLDVCAACAKPREELVRCGSCEGSICRPCADAHAPGSLPKAFYNYLSQHYAAASSKSPLICHRCNPKMSLPMSFVGMTGRKGTRKRAEAETLLKTLGVPDAAINFIPPPKTPKALPDASRSVGKGGGKASQAPPAQTPRHAQRRASASESVGPGFPDAPLTAAGSAQIDPPGQDEDQNAVPAQQEDDNGWDYEGLRPLNPGGQAAAPAGLVPPPPAPAGPPPPLGAHPQGPPLAPAVPQGPAAALQPPPVAAAQPQGPPLAPAIPQGPAAALQPPPVAAAQPQGPPLAPAIPQGPAAAPQPPPVAAAPPQGPPLAPAVRQGPAAGLQPPPVAAAQPPGPPAPPVAAIQPAGPPPPPVADLRPQAPAAAPQPQAPAAGHDPMLLQILANLQEDSRRREEAMREDQQRRDAHQLSVLQTLMEQAQQKEARMEERLAAVERGPHSPALNSSSFSTRPRHGIAKLAPISPPTFDGRDYHRWWPKFEAIVDQADIDDSIKLHYLRSSLKGSALSKVAALDCGEGAYRDALARLKALYGSEAAIADSLHKEFAAIDPVRHDCANYEKTVDSLHAHVSNLKRNNVGDGEINAKVHFFLARQPPKVTEELQRLRLGNGASDKPWAMDSLLTALDALTPLFATKAKGTGRGEANGKNERANSRGFDKNAKAEKASEDHAYALGLVSTEQKGKRFPKKPAKPPDKPPDQKSFKGRRCSLCEDQPHKTSECPAFDTPQKRRAEVLRQGLCFNCMSSKHAVGDCPSTYRCAVSDCGKTHHTLLHEDKTQRKSWTRPPAAIQSAALRTEAATDPAQPSIAAPPASARSRQTKMIAFHATIAHPEGPETKAGVFIDQGGTESYIRESVAFRLRLPVLGAETKRVGIFGTKKILTFLSQRVQLKLVGKKGEELEILAWTIPSPCPDLLETPMDLTEDERAKVQAADLLNPPTATTTRLAIDVMVGMDEAHALLFADPDSYTRVSADGRLGIYHTMFGNVLAGSVQGDGGQSPGLQFAHTDRESLLDLERTFQNAGIESEDTKVGAKVREKAFLKEFEKQLEFKDGVYASGMLWREDAPKLPSSNIIGAHIRLGQVVRRLYRQGGVEKVLSYDRILADYRGRNRLVEVPVDVEAELAAAKAHRRRLPHVAEDCQECRQSDEFYVPHFDVEKPGSTSTKTRVVTDGSQPVAPSTTSFNDTMKRGPNLLATIPEIINRARLGEGGVLLGDAMKAYNAVNLKEEEQDKNRILWLKNPRLPTLLNNVVALKYTCIMFGFLSSSFILHAVMRIHAEKYDTELAKRAAQSHYVDDFLIPVRCHPDGRSEDHFEVYQYITRMYKEGGFHIRHWMSSNQGFNEQIHGQADAHPELDKDEVPLLGLNFHHKLDRLGTKRHSDTHLPTATKRQLVKAVAQLGFCPLGLPLPILMKARILISQLWKLKLDWDIQIPEELEREGQAVVASLRQMSALTIPRLMVPKPQRPYLFLVFSDASEAAMAALVLAWQQDEDGLVTCNFVGAVGKVAALRPKRTIVQQELCAALMGVRLARTIADSLPDKPAHLHLWSDSSIILAMCRQSVSSNKFFQVRVDEIMLGDFVPTLHHIEGANNVADFPSRGTSFENMDWKAWLQGPAFLHSGGPEDWTIFESRPEELEEEPELSSTTNQLVHAESRNSIPPEHLERLDPERFSSLARLLRVTAFFLRAVNRFKTKNRERPATPPWITAGETKAALRFIIRKEQGLAFPASLAALSENRITPYTLSLDLFLDKDGLIRKGDRLCRAPLPYDQIHPILLGKKRPFTTLAILQSHLLVGHQRVRASLAAYRLQYWTPGGERIIDEALRSCAACRLVRGGPLRPPRFGPLPLERLQADRAFQFAGLDHTGGIEIRGKDGHLYSIFILIYVCMVTRAVHLTWTSSTSAQDLILALRRIWARRGRAQTIFSDRASGLIKASEELREEQGKLGDFLGSKLTEWRLQSPLSPWTSGVWERLIGSTKKILRHSLWRRKLSVTELTTFLDEAEGILNTRPLCQLEDSDDVLTPAHFIAPSTQLGMPHSLQDADDPDFGAKSTRKSLSQAFRKNQTLLRLAWGAFQSAFLPFLRESVSNFHKRVHGDVNWSPKVGAIYLLKEDDLARMRWKRVRVMELLPGEDGLVRFVRVLFPNGHITQRGVKALHPLECELNPDDQPSPLLHRCPSPAPPPTPPPPPPEKPAQQRYNFRPRPERLGEKGTAAANKVLHKGAKPQLIHALLACVLLLSGTASAAGSQETFQICRTGHGGRVLQLPEVEPACGLHQPRHQQRQVLVDLFVPTSEYENLPAQLIYEEHILACTSYAFGGGTGFTVPPTISRLPVSREYAEQINATRRALNTSLSPSALHPHRLSTNFTLDIAYKWLSYNFCSEVKNFVLELGSVSSLSGADVISSFGGAGQDCHFTLGFCKLDDATAIWSRKDAHRSACSHQTKGRYEGIVNRDLLLVHSLQSAFHLVPGRPPACLARREGQELQKTLEGAFVRLHDDVQTAPGSPTSSKPPKPPRPRRQAAQEEYDPANAKLNFLEAEVERKMETFYLQFHHLYCTLAQSRRKEQEMFLQLDPTIGLRYLLNRSDIAGEWRGGRVHVHLCQSVGALRTHKNYQHEQKCYQLQPVEVNGSSLLWFLAPDGSRDLVPYSPEAPCSEVADSDKDSPLLVPAHLLQPLLAWNASLRLEPMATPPLYHSRVHFPASALRLMAGQTGRLDARIHGLIRYGGSFSWDSEKVIRTLEATGEIMRVTHEEAYRVIGTVISSGVSKAGEVVAKLESPVVRLLYALGFGAAALVALGVFVLLLLVFLRAKRTEARLPPVQDPPPLTSHAVPIASVFRRSLLRRRLLRPPLGAHRPPEEATPV